MDNHIDGDLVLAGALDVDGDGRHIMPVYLRTDTPAKQKDKLARIEARAITDRDVYRMRRIGYAFNPPLPA